MRKRYRSTPYMGSHWMAGALLLLLLVERACRPRPPLHRRFSGGRGRATRAQGAGEQGKCSQPASPSEPRWFLRSRKLALPRKRRPKNLENRKCSRTGGGQGSIGRAHPKAHETKTPRLARPHQERAASRSCHARPFLTRCQCSVAAGHWLFTNEPARQARPDGSRQANLPCLPYRGESRRGMKGGEGGEHR